MSQPEKVSETITGTTVVDTDVHVSVSAEQMATYVDSPYEDRLLNSSLFPASNGSDWDPHMSGDIHKGKVIESPKDVNKIIQKEFQIEHPILNPSIGLDKLPDPVAAKLMQARNDAFIESFLDDTDFHGLGMITSKKPDTAAEEIDRLGDEDQIVGVVIECLGSKTPLGDPKYDIMYQAAEDNNLHIAYHTEPAGNFMYDFPSQKRGVQTFSEVDAVGHLWGQSLTLTSLIVQGVPEKFPNLNFSFLESGLTWVPYLMWRLNKEYAIRRSEAPLLTKSPEEYIREQFYFASQPLGNPNDPQQLQQLIKIIGSSSIMFASDYPHWDFDHPNEFTQHLQSMFTSEEQRQILETTPVKAFDLDI